MQCDAFITVVVTAGGICRNPDVGMGKDADPEATRHAHTQGGEVFLLEGDGRREGLEEKARGKAEKTAARV